MFICIFSDQAWEVEQAQNYEDDDDNAGTCLAQLHKRIVRPRTVLWSAFISSLRSLFYKLLDKTLGNVEGWNHWWKRPDFVSQSQHFLSVIFVWQLIQWLVHILTLKSCPTLLAQLKLVENKIYVENNITVII